MVKDCCCMTHSNLVDFFQFSSGTFRECGAYRSPGAGGGQSTVYGLQLPVHWYSRKETTDNG